MLDHKLIRLPQVLTKTGLSKSVLYDLISKSNFPKGILISKRIRVWDNEIINIWIKSKLDKEVII